MTDSTVISKIWNLANVLRDDGEYKINSNVIVIK